jgi:hypothetical protein
MVRTSKSSASASASAAAPVSSSPAVVAAVSETAAAAAAPKTRTRKPKVEAQVAPVSDVAPVLETAVDPSVSAPVVAAIEPSTIFLKLTEYGAKFQQLTGSVSLLKNEFKALEKSILRELKLAQKASSKKRRSNVNRKPSGFIKPTRISDELASFLGKTVGTEMARTEVSREINAYIQSNKLQDKENGRKIHPDAKLSQLLKLGGEDELTYFNLQRYMKHHFIKAEVPAVVV